MIKREHIKQAIDAISRRDPEIGYSLDEMLGMGLIDVPSTPDKDSQPDAFYFLFENEKVPVNKFSYLNEGIVPIEQGLLIKYGEMVKKQEFLNRGYINYQNAAREIREAGLKLIVTYEIDYAIARLRKRMEMLETDTHLPNDETPGMKQNPRIIGLISFLERLKRDNRTLMIPQEGRDSAVLYRGMAHVGTPALFMGFPFFKDALMQVADINVAFFHVRFILNCLICGLKKNLFACVVDQKIVGLIYITFKERMFYKGLEIKFAATLRGKKYHEEDQGPLELKGVGTFLVAGVWILWKTQLEKVKEVFLDAEIRARRFYESIGFEPRGLASYVLKHPKGYLIKDILVMANNCSELRKSVIKEIESLIKKQIRSLRKKAKSERRKSVRKAAIASIKECLRSGARPEFAEAAVNTLLKHKKKIPESKELIQFVSEFGSDKAKAYIEGANSTCH